MVSNQYPGQKPQLKVTQAKSLKVFISKYGTKNAVILSANPQRIKTAKSGPARYLPLYIAGKLREIFP